MQIAAYITAESISFNCKYCSYYDKKKDDVDMLQHDDDVR